MKHCFTWVGIIIFSVMLLFTVEASATSPFADVLPDIRLIEQGSTGAPKTVEPAFDLDDYVIDYDETDDVLGWAVSGDVNGSGLPTVTIAALNEVDVFAHSPAGLYSATFTVTDQDTATDESASVVKYSSFFVTEPKFTADNRLSFQGPGLPRFTYVKLFDGSGYGESFSLSGYLVSDAINGTAFNPASAVFGPMIVHDIKSGAPVEVARGNDLNLASTVGGLEVSLSAASGLVTLTPSGSLSCAVLISIPAVLEGSTFDESGDWDGAVIMVAPALEIDTFPAWTSASLPAANLAQACRFENIPAGATLQPDGAGSNANRTQLGGAWQMRQIKTFALPTASLVNSTLPSGTGEPGNAANQFADAMSGNVVKLAFDNSSGSDVMAARLTTFNITPVLPGQIYGCSVNISSDIPSAQAASFANAVRYKLQVLTKPDQGVIYSTTRIKDSNGESCGLPTDGQWVQTYEEVRAPELNVAVDDGTGAVVNLMEAGLIININLFVDAGTPAFNLYLDNVYLYCKGMSDVNYTDANEDEGGAGLLEKGLANGITALPSYNAINPTANGDWVDLGLDSGSTFAANNWRNPTNNYPLVTAPSTSATCAVAVNQGRLLLPGTSNSLMFEFPDGVPSGAVDGYRAISRGIAISGLDNADAPIAGAPNLAGESYYGISAWVASDGAELKDNPQVKILVTEIRPTLNQLNCTVLVGPSCVPLNSEWVQYSAVCPFPNMLAGQPAMQRAQVTVQVDANSAWQSLGDAAWGNLNTTGNQPGYEGDARVYVDDIVIHRVRDDIVYWDYSLFD